MKQPYNTALYMRLSRDDENYGDSVSIETQRTILRQFAKENQLHVMDEYIDDGWSGTNFERPNFQRMMDDVELGKINCIVTKDLSRFGREHVMMDYYLEFVFPEKKIRYIAVSDNEDTEKGLSDFVPFKNLFNEWFAKDTSRKVKTALHAKFAAGQHICTYAPIGYKKHSEVKNLLEIDEETRWIVEKIFDLAYRGAGAAKITNILIDEQIPTAGWLNYTRYGKFAHIYAEAPEEKRYAWTISQAFGGNFTSIVISDSVTDIENGAFADCPNLRSIHFPSSVNNIPVEGLFNCKYLESLSVDPENPNYTSSGNCIIDKRTGILILGTNNGTIPSDGSVNEIGAKAFINRSGLTDIVIPEGVTSIGEYAFANCTALKSVSMPNSLIEINHYAFSGCSSLKEMKIVAAVVIFDYAFKDCTGLESIDLPDSCEVLHGMIFENCIALKTVKLPATLKSLNCLFVNCPSLESITLPAALTQIDSNPFVDCDNLRDCRFAGSVKEWNAVEKPLFWSRGSAFTMIHCSDGDATP